MLIDHWPLLGLSLRTARLELRLPRDEELGELAEVAARGVHAPGRMPFLRPWTDATPGERARSVVRHHWQQRGRWEPDDWVLDLAVFLDGRPVGVQSIEAQRFATVREVDTGSWLGLEYQGRGIGTEMRHAVLHLAFAGLGALDARSAAFTDNPASLAVSHRLGYRPDGIQRDALQGRAVTSQRLRLTRAGWELTHRPPVTVSGLGPCLPEFGLTPG